MVEWPIYKINFPAKALWRKEKAPLKPTLRLCAFAGTINNRDSAQQLHPTTKSHWLVWAITSE